LSLNPSVRRFPVPAAADDGWLERRERRRWEHRSRSLKCALEGFDFGDLLVVRALQQ
jgi:hypothetical protein